jgi:hypothetical protein
VATSTPNYGLIKPSGNPPGSGGDLIDVDNFNDNSDIIDAALHAHDLSLADINTELTDLGNLYPVAEQEVNDNSSHGPISTVETTILALPALTFSGTDKYKVFFSTYNFVFSVATDTYFVRLYDGATMIREWLLAGSTVNFGGFNATAIWTPAAGNRAVAIKAIRNSGTGTLTAAAAPIGMGTQIGIAPLIKDLS